MDSKRMSRRRLLQFMGFGAAAVTLSACAPPEEVVEEPEEEEPEEVVEEPEEEEPAPKESVTVRYHARIGEQENQLYEMQEPKFMEEYPHITVELENFPGDEYLTKISTMHAGGTIGDVVWSALGGTQIQNITSAGIAAPLDDIVDSTGYDLDQFYQGCLEGLTVEGELMGLPFKAHPGMAITYYNIDLLEEAGFEPPSEDWTHDDQVEMVMAVRDLANGEPIFGISPNTSWKRFTTLMRSFGGELLSEDGGTIQLTSDEGMAATERLYDFYQTWEVAPPPEQVIGDINQMWTSGYLGMFEAGTWAQVLGNTIGDRFEWFAVNNAIGPAGVGGSDYEVDSYTMTTSAKDPEAAWEWMKYLCSQESGVLLGVIGGTVGGRPDVYRSEVLLRDPIREVFADIMDEAASPRIPANYRLVELQDALVQVTEPLWAGDEEPTEAYVGQIEEQLQEILDKPRP